MESKLVSTVITTYKRSDTLFRAIESVLNQTYSSVEIIVVDDNDEDSEYRRETEELMNKYKEDKRVTYIKHKKNLNGAAARNTGLKYFKGEYITFLDDDDFFHKDRFKILIPKLEKTKDNTGVIVSGFQFYRDNKKYKTGKATHSNFIISNLINSKFTLGSGSNFILKRAVIKQVEGFDTNFERNQDVEFLVRVADTFDFIVSDDILLNIQVDSNTQNKISIDKMIKTKEQFLAKYEYLIEKHNFNYQEVFSNNMKRVVYLILYYNREKEYKQFVVNYVEKLDFLGKLKFGVWALNIKIKNIIKSFYFISE